MVMGNAKHFWHNLRMFDGCSVAISDHQLLIIGAYYSRQQVGERPIGFNLWDQVTWYRCQNWTFWVWPGHHGHLLPRWILQSVIEVIKEVPPFLNQGRVGHSCAVIGEDVVIAGFYNCDNLVLWLDCDNRKFELLRVVSVFVFKGGYGEERSALETTTIINLTTRCSENKPENTLTKP